ncbi:large ribosomal subunit protein mL42 [Clarias gariepinus]|uniref:39S ribosomal protein L42, mitochondrial n=1 Tax=Clarias gariepinus TaxID=13013 RepID=UPI00234DE106|nr:39S ribosomal protein L42, mitochondrial [Clarias gariepinus]
MAAWRRLTCVSLTVTRASCNGSTHTLQGGARAFRSASGQHLTAPDNNGVVDLAVARDGKTIVCFHPAPDVAYELTKPIPSTDATLDSTETHDLVLKSQLHKDVLKNQKTPAVEELAKMFYTTKHRWYPVGQYHTRRRNRDPPKDR